MYTLLAEVSNQYALFEKRILALIDSARRLVVVLVFQDALALGAFLMALVPLGTHYLADPTVFAIVEAASSCLIGLGTSLFFVMEGELKSMLPRTYGFLFFLGLSSIPD